MHLCSERRGDEKQKEHAERGDSDSVEEKDKELVVGAAHTVVRRERDPYWSQAEQWWHRSGLMDSHLSQYRMLPLRLTVCTGRSPASSRRRALQSTWWHVRSCDFD